MSEFGEMIGDAIIGIVQGISGFMGFLTITMGIFMMSMILPYGLFGLTVAGVITGIVFGVLCLYGVVLLMNDKRDSW